jgi:hypothetical protein
MIVLPARVRNLLGASSTCSDSTAASQAACHGHREEERHTDKNRFANDWLAATLDGAPIDVVVGNR